MQTNARQDNHQTGEKRESRGSFLRKLGKTVAIGLGVTLVPATNAWAVNSQCCRDTTCPSCPTGQNPYRCTECSGYQPSSCCDCQEIDFSGCRQYGCGVCSSP